VPTKSPALPADANPFATCWTRPGAIEYLFPEGQSAANLVERLEGQNWQGQIVGPHGSGKTTLLDSLLSLLKADKRDRSHFTLHQRPPSECASIRQRKQTDESPKIRPVPFICRNVIHVRLAGGERRLPIAAGSWREWNDRTLLVVDGFEQLRRWTRARVKRACRARNCGLLVTAHCDVGMPELYRTEVSLELACRVVAALPPEAGRVISNRDVAECLARHPGNMREVLFALYDLYERRRRAPDATANR
jgi:energy-coupling factor transporter ATP-binding protein EcfA2